MAEEQTIVSVRNQTRKTSISERTAVAGSSAERRKGLLGRDCLEPGSGLLIVPCESVHSFGMRFPIDVVYLDRNRKVRKVRENMVPRRFSADLLAHSVLELPAGTIRRTHTQPGDQLEIQRV
ncbi:MAG TPA: DUF192 domain-containing protein [Bryobacteraceae bacterium]|jgi:uncharacterized membrane protein (UPF0127 family)|nr:DUF192 domain-containing protein [Bryobacteraceae bacterium]